VAAENKSPDSLPDTQSVIFQHVDPSDSSKDAFGTAILSCYGLPAMSTLAEFASAVTVYRNVKSSKELRAVGQLVEANAKKDENGRRLRRRNNFRAEGRCCTRSARITNSALSVHERPQLAKNNYFAHHDYITEFGHGGSDRLGS